MGMWIGRNRKARVTLGFLIPAIRFPTVPRGKARLRLTCTAAHTPEDVGRLANALKLLRQPQA